MRIKSNDIIRLNELVTLDTHKNIGEQFRNIAEQLFSRCLIKVKENYYKINEIEFYYYSEKHRDPYVHRDVNQNKKGCWYFHKKEGSFKGVDITFGATSYYGGILIRSLESLDNSHCVQRPSKVVDEILVLHGCKKVKEFLNKEPELYLNFNSQSSCVKEIYNGKRIGLKLKKEDSDGYFLNKKYRFCMNILSATKDKKGLTK